MHGMISQLGPRIVLAGLCILLNRQAQAGSDTPVAAKKPESKWAFTAPRKSPVPEVTNKIWVKNPIDAFILAKLEGKGLSPSGAADKLTLLRRVTFDLTGLPPTLQEQDAFLADSSADAYSKVVDRLLASTRYGERWAQHWLDLVRYAETDGFKADDLRPNAFRYRDYVIKAFNDDLPYDRFIRQQLAGDELEPGNPEALIATGFNRLWPDEYNSATLEQRRQEILDDETDVTAAVFLGLTFGCARCHDHKFDPISQKDYFHLQAFFAPMQPRDDLIAADAGRKKDYEQRLKAWEAATKDKRAEMEALLGDKRPEARKHALEKFRKEIQEAVLTPKDKRTPYQESIALMAEKQMDRAEKEVPNGLPEDKKKRYKELEQKLAKVEPKRPEPPPTVMAITDLGKEAPPTYLLAGGDWRKPRKELPPAFPELLGEAKPDTTLPAGVSSTGRRAALARWLTSKENPLTARVMVNRLWQHHFGVGIVATPSDYGAQGEPPTHPELLDWLAANFIEHGWSLKHLHRLMVTSAAYCQTSLVDMKNAGHAKAYAVDRENKLLWHARRRRLEGEAVRDALLSLSGELNPRMYGPSARPKLPDHISSYAWKPDAKPEDQNRRSVYVFVKRNMRYPLFDAFDLPDLHNSCARRAITITAPQALLLLNGDFTLEGAQHWSSDLLKRFPKENESLVAQAYQTAWGQKAGKEDIRLGLRFLDSQTSLLGSPGSKPAELCLPTSFPKEVSAEYATALVDFCHAILNANEFLFVD